MTTAGLSVQVGALIRRTGKTGDEGETNSRGLGVLSLNEHIA